MLVKFLKKLFRRKVWTLTETTPFPYYLKLNGEWVDRLGTRLTLINQYGDIKVYIALRNGKIS